MNPDYLISLCLPLLQNPLHRSLVWTFLRTIPEPAAYDESMEVSKETFLKEFQASQVCFSRNQIFSYEYLNLSAAPTTLSPSWARMARSITYVFAHKLKRMKDLYPAVQRIKCLSRETAMLYEQRYPGTPVVEVTTSKLEVHYGHTGEEIGGPCEMRTVWRFNDLKPRFYYAQGGRDYFASRYMKKFAVLLMESIVSTQMERRRDPDAFITIPEDHFLTTWDFSAFTSNLSELKFFLYHIARGLEEVGEEYVNLVDYFLGKVQKLPSSMIDDYSNTVNNAAAFTIYRVVDRLGLNFDKTQDYYQQNSGMLGVAGNIGFSTACHGYHVCTVCDRQKCVCVGDDAFGGTREHPSYNLIPTMQALGNIHPDKFEIVPPLDPGPVKFLKRGMTRDPNGGLWLNKLFPLPIPAFADLDTGHRNVPPNFEIEDRRYKIAVQTGSLLWSIYDAAVGYQFDQQELADIELYLSILYAKVGFSRNGQLPHDCLKGSLFGGRPRPLGYLVPVIDFSTLDPRKEDWAAFMLDNTIFFLNVPLESPGEICPLLPIPGDEVIATQHEKWKVLEDMGYVEITELKQAIQNNGSNNKRKMMNFLKSVKTGTKLVELHVIRDIPTKFIFMFSPDPTAGSICNQNTIIY